MKSTSLSVHRWESPMIEIEPVPVSLVPVRSKHDENLRKFIGKCVWIPIAALTVLIIVMGTQIYRNESFLSALGN